MMPSFFALDDDDNKEYNDHDCWYNTDDDDDGDGADLMGIYNRQYHLY